MEIIIIIVIIGTIVYWKDRKKMKDPAKNVRMNDYERECLIEVGLDNVIKDVSNHLNLQDEMKPHYGTIRESAKHLTNRVTKKYNSRNINSIVNITAAFVASIMIVECFDLYNELAKHNEVDSFPTKNTLYIFLADLGAHEIDGNFFKLYKGRNADVVENLRMAVWHGQKFGEESFKRCFWVVTSIDSKE